MPVLSQEWNWLTYVSSVMQPSQPYRPRLYVRSAGVMLRSTIHTVMGIQLQGNRCLSKAEPGTCCTKASVARLAEAHLV